MTTTKKNIQQAYNDWAEIYDSNENPTRDLSYRVIREEQLELSGKKVLEIGCGTGLNTVYLAREAQQVVGVDFSDKMLARARKRIKGDGICNTKLVAADITKPWSFEDKSFDFVIGNLVLEHIQNLLFVFKEVFRVLNPSGKYYMTELHPYKQLQQSQAKFVSRQTGKEVLVDAFKHPVSEYVNKALSAGFNLEEMKEYYREVEDIPRLLTLLFEKPD